MTHYQSTLSLPDVAALLARARRVLITTHVKPDGDAYGAVVAMAGALRNRGVTVHAWVMPPLPASFDQIRGRDMLQIYRSESPLSWPDVDLVIVLDTGAAAQILPLRDTLSQHLDKALVLDHHLSGDLQARWRYIDGKAAACCEIVADVLEEMEGHPIGEGHPVFDATVCEAIFVGIASDTGWFRFSNTRPRSHELAARLLRCGVDHSELYRKLEQNERPAKLALLSRALASLQLLADNKIAMMVLRARDFSDTGALLEETERFVDAPQFVGAVELTILVTEVIEPSGSPMVRINFRSKPSPAAVNVAALAGQFGGGGHARAAGAKVKGRLDDVLPRITAAATSAVK